jgi:hypothetical protein
MRLAADKVRLNQIIRKMQSLESDGIELLDADDRAAVEQMIVDADVAEVEASHLEGMALPSSEAGSRSTELPDLYRAIDAMFPVGTTNRYVWDDMVANIVKRGVGAGSSSCRYSSVTMNVAMSVLLKTGASAYDSLASLFCLPSSRTVRKMKAGSMECGIVYDSVDFINCKIDLEVAEFPEITRKNASVGCLSFDAMIVKGRLLYSANTGRVTGLSLMDTTLHTVQKEFSTIVNQAAGAQITQKVVTATTYVPLSLFYFENHASHPFLWRWAGQGWCGLHFLSLKTTPYDGRKQYVSFCSYFVCTFCLRRVEFALQVPSVLLDVTWWEEYRVPCR